MAKAAESALEEIWMKVKLEEKRLEIEEKRL